MSNKTQYTPEPWVSKGNEIETEWNNHHSDTPLMLAYFHRSEDAARAVACVNALAGIENPEQYLSELTATIAAHNIQYNPNTSKNVCK